uniref:Uncharacterized protein n=1 Tax=Octopus bimaculoides TaxID=37653 RepID=A0A0L8H2Z3_OCTBM
MIYNIIFPYQPLLPISFIPIVFSDLQWQRAQAIPFPSSFCQGLMILSQLVNWLL